MPLTAQNSLQLPLFQFEVFQKQTGLVHAISTRQAPALPLLPRVQPLQSNDYRLAGRAIYNQREIIYGRRTELLVALGIQPEQVQANLVGIRQIHSNIVINVDHKAYGAGWNWDTPIGDGDGLVTNLPNIPLMTIHADCPPILLYDPIKKVIGAVHSGWRGTTSKIALQAVKTMQATYGSNPQDILAGIGPSIGVCCYEVDEPVLSEVRQAFGEKVVGELLIPKSNGKHQLNLWQAIELTLLEAGLQRSNIEQSQLCTLCHKDTFFSYRATPLEERDNYGQFISLIMLTKPN